MYVQQRQESQIVEQQLSDLIIQREYIQKSSSDYSSAPAFIRADIKRHEDKKSSLSIKTKRTQQELRSTLKRLCDTKIESWKEAQSTSPTGDDASKFHTMEQKIAAFQSKINELEAQFTKTQASELRMSKIKDQALTKMAAMEKQVEDLKCKTRLLETKQEENERAKEIRQLTNANKNRDDEILSVQTELNRANVVSLQLAVKKLEHAVGNLEATKLGDSEKQAADLSKTFAAFRKKYGIKYDTIRGELRQIKEDVDASHKKCMPSNDFEVAVNRIVQNRMSNVDNWMQGVDHGILNMDTKLQEILTIWQRSAATSTPTSLHEGLRGEYRPNKRPRTDSCEGTEKVRVRHV